MNMKWIAAIALLTLSAAASADTYVRPYVRSDGTYVQGHYRSSPNTYRYDNYSAGGRRQRLKIPNNPVRLCRGSTLLRHRAFVPRPGTRRQPL
jgi:hypothetical protein